MLLVLRHFPLLAEDTNRPKIKKTKDVPIDTDEDDDIIQEESKSFGD